MNNLPKQSPLSLRVMKSLRRRYRQPVTFLMLACTVMWTFDSRGTTLYRMNTGSTTFLDSAGVSPISYWAQGSGTIPAISDIIAFNNAITGATTFRVSNANGFNLAIGGVQVANPSGAITIQNADNQSQTLTLGSSGIDMGLATQNLTFSNATGGTLSVATSAPQNWLIRNQRTLAFTNSPLALNHDVTLGFQGGSQGGTAGTLAVTTSISGAGNLNVTGMQGGTGGTVTLSRSNAAWTGAVTLSGGARLNLDQSAGGQNKLADSKVLTVNRGIVNLQGTGGGTETVAGVSLGQGMNQILRSAGTGVLQANTITGSSNALLDVGNIGTSTGSSYLTTDNLNVNGMLGTWAIGINGTTDANWLKNGTGAADGAVIALSGADYTTQNAINNWNTATQNILVTGATTAGTASKTINSLKISAGSTAVSVDLGAANTLTINDGQNGGGIIRVGNAATTLGGATVGGGFLTAGAADGTADVLRIFNLQNTMTINNVIKDNGAAPLSLNLGGVGTVQLAATNTFTGGIVIAAGTLNLGTNAATGDAATLGTGSIVNYGTLVLNKSTAATGANAIVPNDISGTGSLTSTRGTMTLSGSNSYSGDTLVSTGTLKAGSAGGLSANSRLILNASQVTLDLNGFSGSVAALTGAQSTAAVALGNGTLTLSGSNLARPGANDTLLSLTTQTYQGVISGTGGLVKSGAYAQTLSAGGALSYTGLTTVNNGTLQTNKVMSTSGVTVNGGTFIANIANALPDNAIITLGGSGATYAMRFSDTVGGLAGVSNARMDLTAGSTLTVNDNGGSPSAFDGVITGNASFAKGGSNTLILGGGNSFTGSTTINGGTLRLASGSAVEMISDRSAVILANAAGALLDVNGRNETIGSLAGGGTAGGDVSLGSGRLTVGGVGTSTAFGGQISGSGSLVKVGNGTLTLSGTNSFTGGLEIRSGGVTLSHSGGGTLASAGSIKLNGLGATLNVSSDQTAGAVTGARGTAINLGAGAALSSSYADGAPIGLTATSNTTLRTVNLNAGSTNGLRPGMVVSGPGMNAGAQIVQILNDRTFLINQPGAFTVTDSLSITPVNVLGSSLAGAGGFSKSGAGLLILTGDNTNTGDTTINDGTVQVGGIWDGARYAFQDILSDASRIQFAPGGTQTLNFASNATNLTPFERIGSLGGGSATATVNLVTGASVGVLAVGADDTSSTFSGIIAGNNAATWLLKEGSGTFTWNNNVTDVFNGTLRLEQGGVTVGGSAGLDAASRVVIGNRTGTLFSNSVAGGESIASINGGAGAVRTFPNGVTGALIGNYIGQSGGELWLGSDLTLTDATAANVFAYNGALTGTGGLTKTGASTLVLGGNNTFSGVMIVGGGTVRLGFNSRSAGVGSVLGADSRGSLADSLNLQMGGTGLMDFQGMSETVGTLTSAGGTPTVSLGNGTLTLANASGSFSGSITGGGSVVVGGSGTWTLGSGALNGPSMTVGASSTVVLDSAGNNALGDATRVTLNGTMQFSGLQTSSETLGAISGSGSLQLGSNRTVTLTDNVSGTFSGTIGGDSTSSLVLTGGRMTLSGTSAVPVSVQNQAILRLDLGLSGTPDLLQGTGPAALSLGGGTVTLHGTGIEAVAGTTLMPGASRIVQTPGSDGQIDLGEIVRSTGSALLVGENSAITSTPNLLSLAPDILGGYAVHNNSDWAVSNGAGVVTGLGSYGSTWAPDTNYNVTGDDTVDGSVGTVRFDAPSPVTLTIGSNPAVVESGGILVTPNVADNVVTILSSGQILAGGAAPDSGTEELFFHQFANRGTLLVAAPVVDYLGSLTVVKTGLGRVVFNQDNFYNGNTYIYGGIVQLGDGGAGGSLGGVAGASQVVNHGVIEFNRSDDILSYGVDITGTGSLVKKGSGSVGLFGNNTYTGSTSVQEGVLVVNSNNALGSTQGMTSVSAGAVLELQGGLISPESVLVKGATLRASFGSPTLSGYVAVMNDSLFAAEETYGMTLSGSVMNYSGKQMTFGTLGPVGIGTGEGTVILAGSNLWGSTAIAAGTLQIGNNTNGSLGRGPVVNNGNLVFNTNNGHFVVTNPISGSGNVVQFRNTVYLAGDNTYSGTTTVGSATQNANVRVGVDTYTGSLGTGDIFLRSSTGASQIRYHLLADYTIANDVFITANANANADWVREGLGTMSMTGNITTVAGPTTGSGRALITVNAGGRFVLTGNVNDSPTVPLNLNNNNVTEIGGTGALTLNGIMGGGGVWIYNRDGEITLNGVNTASSGNNYIHRGTVVATGSSFQDDTDLHVLRGATLRVDASETIGQLYGVRGSTIQINGAGTTLTLDDNAQQQIYGNITGAGSLTLLGGNVFLFNGDAKDFTGTLSVGNGRLQTNNIQNAGVPSGLGAGSTIFLGGSSTAGAIEYVGPGASTDRNFVLDGSGGTGRIIGNGNGALILNGNVTTNGNNTLLLGGQSKMGNTLNGLINQGGSVISLALNQATNNDQQYGLGSWALTNAGSNFSGNVSIPVGSLILQGDLGNGAVTTSPLGNLTLARTITLGTANFDGFRPDGVGGGGDGLGAAGGTGSTGTLVFNDPNPGTATFGANITFTNNANSTTNPGNAELINNGTKVIVINGGLTKNANGNSNWVLDGTNTGTNTINGVISNGSASTVSILKEGPGTWRINNAANTFSGGLTVARGTLEVSGGGAINDAATVNLTNAGSDGSSVGAATFRILTSEAIGGLAGAIGTSAILDPGTLLTVTNASQTFSGTISGGGSFKRFNNDTNARVSTLPGLNTFTGSTSIMSLTGGSAAANRIDLYWLADGGAASGIGASGSAASNLVIDTFNTNGGLRWLGFSNQTTDRLLTIGANSSSNATAGAAAIWSDGVVIGNNAPSIKFTNSGAVAFTASNLAATLTLRGANQAMNVFSPQLNNNGSGIVNFQKTELGTWVLTANNGYSGTTTIAQGILGVENSGALGTGTVVNVTGGGNRTFLDLRNGVTMASNKVLTITGTSGNAVGVGSSAGANTWAGTVTLATSGQSHYFAPASGATLTLSNKISGAGNFEKIDLGTLVLSGDANAYTGANNVRGGTLVLDYSAFDNTKLADGTALVLGGNVNIGTIQYDNAGTIVTRNLGGNNAVYAHGATIQLTGGSHTEIVSATTLDVGASYVTRTSGTARLRLNAITRNSGGTIDFAQAGVADTDTVNTSGGILGGHATVGKTNWAVSASSGADILINALGSYSNDSYSANANTDVVGFSNAPSGGTTHTMRFNQAGGGNLNLNGVLNLETGGILMTPNSGAVTISGGAIQRSATTAGLDTVILQYSSNPLTIASVLQNNSGAQALTKSGNGTLILTGENTFSGGVFINEGTVKVGNGGATGTLSSGAGALVLNGTLEFNSTQGTAFTQAGTIAGDGSIVLAPTNTRTIILTGSNTGWNGGSITINGGTLAAGSSGNALGTNRVNAYVNSGGTLDIRVATVLPSIYLSGTGRLLDSTGNGSASGPITISGSNTSIETAAGTSMTLSGLITSSTGLNKNGNGILTISASQMTGLLEGQTSATTAPALLGQVRVNQGELRLGNARALGGTGVGNETIVASGATLDLRGQSLNYGDDPDPNREIVWIEGAGVNGTGAIRNSSGTGQISNLVLTADATLGTGGSANGARLDLNTYDNNPATGSSLAGAFTPNAPTLAGNGHNLTVVGNGTLYLHEVDITNLNKLTLTGGRTRIEQNVGPNTTWDGFTTAEIANGIEIGYAGPTFADFTNTSLGLGTNVGARLDFFRNADIHHNIPITMNGVLAAANGGHNYIELNVDTIPSVRTYLEGNITLLGDATRNIFNIDGATSNVAVQDQGNTTSSLQSKLVVNGALVGSGGFTKTGYRELRLTSNNSYTGGTVIARFGAISTPAQSNTVSVNGVDYPSYGNAETWAEWGVTLNGPNGAMSSTSSLNLSRRGMLSLDNTHRLDATSGVIGANNNNRLNDAATINFNHGWLRIYGGSVNNTESLATSGGAKMNVLSGTNILDLWPTDGANTNMTLTIGEITRSAGAVLRIADLDATSTFSTAAPGGADSVRVALNTLGTLTESGAGTGLTDRKIVIGLLGGIIPDNYLDNQRILSSGVADSLAQGRNLQFLAGSHFMTYDGGFLRPLDDSEYAVPANGLLEGAGVVGQNVDLLDNFTIARGDVTVNSLRFGALADHNGSGGALNDGTTVTSNANYSLQLFIDNATVKVDSGMLSSAYYAAGNTSSLSTLILGGAVDFGSREGIINNQNGVVRTTDGAIPTGNLEVRSNILGTGGVVKTGLAQVVFDGMNSYSGLTTISDGVIFVRNGRMGLGAGGAGNGVVIVGNGSLNSGNGVQIGTPASREDIYVGVLQGDQQIMRVDNDVTNWYSNVVIDNVDEIGQPLFTPRIRTDNGATSIINGNIYGGNTPVTNDVFAVDSRVVQFDTAGNNVFLLRGQFGDKGDASGNAIPIPNPISALPTLAGVRTNENEVLRVNLAGGNDDSNFVLDRQYNAAGRLTVIRGNLLVNYDPAAAGNDGAGFWTATALSRIPSADSTTSSFTVNGGSAHQGFVFGNGSNTATSLFLTKPNQLFNMASWSTAGTGAKVIGGLNETGTTTFGTGNGALTLSGATARLYASAGGTVVFNQRLTGNTGTAPNSLGFVKIGRGTVILQNNSTSTTAGDANFQLGGGTLILDYAGQNVARVGALNAILSGGTLLAKSNLTAATTANFATDNNTTRVLNFSGGATEIAAMAVGQNMTINLGNANANSNTPNLVRGAGATANFVETVSGGGTPVINMNFNNFSPVIQKNRIVSWATYGNALRQALDFAMVDANATNRVKVFGRAADEYNNNAATWLANQDISEVGGAGFTGTVASSLVLNTLRFDAAADSAFSIGSGQTLALKGDGLAGAMLVSSNVGSANKTIAGGSLSSFGSTTTGTTTSGSTAISGLASVAGLVPGMAISGSGIPAGATITAITGASSITISAAATASAGGVSLATYTPEVLIHHYANGNLNVNSKITNNAAGTATSLVIAGPTTTEPGQIGSTGAVVLGNSANDYTGGTRINGAVLSVSDVNALGANPASPTNGNLTLNGGTLRYTGEGYGDLGNRGVRSEGSGGTIEVTNAGAELRVSANLQSEEIFRGDIVKVGGGTLALALPEGTTGSGFQGLMDVREGALRIYADNSGAGSTTSTILGSSRTWADGTILRSGTSLDVQMGNLNNSGEWTIEEWFTYEGNNLVTVGTLQPNAGAVTGVPNPSIRLVNFNGVNNIQGATTFDVVPSQTMRLNNGTGYLTGAGDIIKDGQGQLEFRSNAPDWTGNLIIKQGTLYAINQADVLGTGYASGKTITLGDSARQGTAQLLVQNDGGVANWLLEINHNIDVVYNPTQTKRIGFDNLANGTQLNFNGDITLNDNLIFYLQDASVEVSGSQGYLNMNGRLKDGSLTSGNILVQATDNGGANDNTNGRAVGYLVLNNDNSAWTGDITVSANTAYDHDKTAVLRFGNDKALTAANDVTMNFNSIVQVGGSSVTIGALTTQGGNGAFAGGPNTIYASTNGNGSTEIIENAATAPGTLTIAQSTPAAVEAVWDAYFRDGVLNSQFFAPGTNSQTPGGSLSLVKQGGGWATLSQHNDYSGTTTVSAGILQVGKAGVGDTGALRAADAAGTLVAVGATLAGTGAVQGMTILNGILSPGDNAGAAMGTITLNGDVAFNAGSTTTLQIQRASFNAPDLLPDINNISDFSAIATLYGASLTDGVSTSQHDRVIVNGEATLAAGAKFNVVLNGYTPSSGDVFTLLQMVSSNSSINVGPDLRGGGEFGYDLQLPILGDDYFWDVSQFATLGILQVVQVANAAPTQLPQIVTHPVSKVVNPGVNVTFSVTASGTGMTYQWQKNQVNIPGGNAPNLTLSNVNQSSEAAYRVIVTNSAGSVVSDEATLIVNDPVSITTPPQSQVVNNGELATFSVVATGTEPFTYQWQRNGVNIPGATSSSYSVAGGSATAGNYRVVVTNIVGSITSANASLVVHGVGPAVVVQQPTGKMVAVGGTTTLSLGADGEVPLAYQWYKNGAKINGATSASLTLSNAAAATAGAYKCVVSNIFNGGPASVTSSEVQVGVVDATPKTVVLADGSKTTLSVTATGNSLTYQWFRNNVAMSGQTAKTLALGPVTTANSGNYVCRVTGPGGAISGGVNAVAVYDKAPIVVLGGPMPNAIVSGYYSYQVPVDSSADRKPTAFAATGLPPGLTINKTTGLISGKPTAAKAVPYAVTLTASNARGKSTVSTTLSVTALDGGSIGTFTAAIPREAVLNANLGGRLDFTTTTGGAVSGKVLLGTSSYSFKGTLETSLGSPLAPTANITVTRSKLTPLTLTFTIDSSTNLVTAGSLSDGTNSVNFDGWRNKWSKTSPATEFTGTVAPAGYYTFGLDIPVDQVGDPAYPQGTGYGSFTVNATTGAVTVSGKLADGEAISWSTFVGPYGQLIAFKTLYASNARGSVIGTMSITSAVPAENSALAGTVNWMRPANPTASATSTAGRTYKAGFGPVDLTAVGGRYTTPVAPNIILGLDPLQPNNATLTFTGAELDQQLPKPDITVSVGAKSKITVPLAGSVDNPRKTTATVATAKGTLSGSFTMVDANPIDSTKTITRKVSYLGLIVRDQTGEKAYGYFLLPQLPAAVGETSSNTLILSGQVILEAPAPPPPPEEMP